MTTASPSPAAAPGTTPTSPPATSVPGATGVALVVQPASGSPPETPAQAPASDPWAGLKPDNLTVVKNKNWANADAAISAYAELERAFSSRPATAAPNAPADISGYTFGKPEGLDPSVQYNDQFAGQFKEWALGAKLSNDQAKAIHDNFVKIATEGAATQREALNTAIATSKTDLVREWGPEKGPAFARNVEMATRAMSQLGLLDFFKSSGALVDVNGALTVANAAVAKSLAKIGTSMFAEDTLYGEQAATLNPFDPKTENVELQGRIFKENPQKAKALILALSAADQARHAYTLSRIK